jgi:outer membrane protein
MHNTQRWLCAIFLSALTVGGAFAQDAAEQQQEDQAAQELQRRVEQGSQANQESLMDIYQRALQNDPSIREAEANYMATAEVKPQARSAILPTLRFSASRSSRYSQNPFGAQLGSGEVIGQGSEFDSDNHSLSVSLSQTVFDWGQFTTLKQADKRVARAETDYEAAKQDLLVRVSNAYFNVLAAEDTLASTIAARESISRQLEQAQRRYDVGLIAITDVQESQAGYDSAVASVIAAQQALATAQESLREIIGELVTNLAGPTDELPLLTPDPASAEQWVNTALGQNLSVISNRIAVDIAQDDITIQRASRLPTLNFSAGYSDQSSTQTATLHFLNAPDVVNPARSAPEGYNWSLDLQVPLFTGGLNSSRIQQAVYSQRAAQQALERVQRQTERETRDAYLGVISSISQVRALNQSVESSRTALRAAEAGFEVGTRTTVDVLTAQNNLRQAETSYARSRYDYILNVLRLKQAAGTLGVDDIEQVDGWLAE